MNLVKDTVRSILFAQGAQVIKRDCLRIQMQHRLNVLRVTDGAVGLVSYRVELEGDHAGDRGNPYTQFAIGNRHRIAVQFIKGARIDINKVKVVNRRIGRPPSGKNRCLCRQGIAE